MDKCKCIDCHNRDVIEDDEESSVASSLAVDEGEEYEDDTFTDQDDFNRIHELDTGTASVETDILAV